MVDDDFIKHFIRNWIYKAVNNINTNLEDNIIHKKPTPYFSFNQIKFTFEDFYNTLFNLRLNTYTKVILKELQEIMDKNIKSSYYHKELQN